MSRHLEAAVRVALLAVPRLQRTVMGQAVMRFGVRFGIRLTNPAPCGTRRSGDGPVQETLRSIHAGSSRISAQPSRGDVKVHRRTAAQGQGVMERAYTRPGSCRRGNSATLRRQRAAFEQDCDSRLRLRNHASFDAVAGLAKSERPAKSDTPQDTQRKARHDRSEAGRGRDGVVYKARDTQLTDSTPRSVRSASAGPYHYRLIEFQCTIGAKSASESTS